MMIEPNMTPEEFRASRQILGLTADGMAQALRLGKNTGRTVRRWEAGESTISGPVALAVELLLLRHSASKGDRKAILERLAAR
jgi:DNA-binding transcriptional regulator YiaG